MIENTTYSGSFSVSVSIKDDADLLSALGVPIIYVNGDPYVLES
mgnify:CR=1